MIYLRLSAIAVAITGAILLAQEVNAQSDTVSSARSELAPTGRLRVAFPVNNIIYAAKNSATGELRGVSIDLGKALASLLGVPFEAAPYNEISALMGSVGSNQWDIATIIVDTDRAKIVDFSAVFMEADATYLVPSNSRIRKVADADKSTVRIAVAEKSAYDLVLTRILTEAVLIRRPNAPAAFQAVQSGDADAVAAARQTLIEMQPNLSGSVILTDRFDATRVSVAVPKGTQAVGLSYVNRFLADTIASGWMQHSIENAGLKGVQAPPN